MADAGDDGVAPGESAEPRYRRLFEHIRDAVVEFEFRGGAPVVRSVNPAFVDTFGYERDLRGESLNDLIVPAWCATEAQSLDRRTAAGEVNYRRVKRETASGLREFLYRGVPLSSDAPRADGIAVYTDLTDIVRHERRLEVMNRVLRHDLRNAVNVVLGNTASLRDDLDDPAARADALESVVAAGADGWADIWVADDGPQIPLDERRVVLGDAAITPVRHGSGLGLWVVKWVTESFGGDVSFAESDLGGNAVRLRLPRPESDRP